MYKAITGKWRMPLALVLCVATAYLLGQYRLLDFLHYYAHNQGVSHLETFVCFLLISPIFLLGLSWHRGSQLRCEVETRKKAEKKYAWLAKHDPLTALPNRRYLDECSSQIISLAGGEDDELVVFYIDLDHFKAVNDAYGHAVGDGVLIEVSRILNRIFDGENDFLMRISGDEFVAITCQNKTDQELNRVARKVIDRINRPMRIDDVVCQVGATVGIAKRSVSGLESERKLEFVIANADLAMAKAKQVGRNRHVFFEPQHRVDYLLGSQITQELRSAIANLEFDVVYQPQFDAATLEVVGVEALVRWNHPTRGVLTPDSFLPQAEALDLLATIDEIVLTRVTQDIDVWRTLGVEFDKVAVNISQQRLTEPDILEKIKRHKVGENRIAFELMESIFFDGDDHSMKDTVNGIKSLGCDVELDDFGTGHASIMSLSVIEPDCMKIDRDLVRPILDSEVQENLVRKIVEIAKSLDIGIVAEGVESREHAEVLRKMGCNTLQGYALARPMPSRELIDFCFSEAVRRVA